MKHTDEIERNLTALPLDRLVSALMAIVDPLTTMNVRLNDNLSAVQARCTELTEELRAVKTERDVLANRYHELESRVDLIQWHDTMPAPASGDHQRVELFAGEVDPRGRSLHDVLTAAERERKVPRREPLPYTDGGRLFIEFADDEPTVTEGWEAST